VWQIRKQDAQDVRLWVYPDRHGFATGFLYQDDGFTFDYQKDIFNLYSFTFKKNNGKSEFTIKLENHKYDGQKTNWKVRVAGSDKDVEFELSGEETRFVIE